MKEFGKFIAILVFSFLAILFKGFVLTKYWTWFVIPLFNIRDIRIVEAVGLSMFVSFLWLQRSSDPDKDLGVTEKFIRAFVIIAVFWGMGWIVSKFY